MLNVIRQSQMLAHFNSCWHLTAAWDLVDTSVLLDQRGSKIHLLRASFVDPLDRPAHVLFTVFESHFDVFPTFLQLSLQWRQRKNAYRISLDKRVEHWNLGVLICLIHAWNRKYPRKEFQISNVKRKTLEKREKNRFLHITLKLPISSPLEEIQSTHTPPRSAKVQKSAQVDESSEGAKGSPVRHDIYDGPLESLLHPHAPEVQWAPDMNQYESHDMTLWYSMSLCSSW